jgi:hypothetical protein
MAYVQAVLHFANDVVLVLFNRLGSRCMVRFLRDPLQWWREALEDAEYGDALSRSKRTPAPMEPQCGFYKRKLVRHGPFVPGRIWVETPVDDLGEADGDEVMKCVVDGRMKEPEDEWTYLCGHPITEREYNHLVKLSRYAKAHDSREPLANPARKIDLNKVPPPVFRQKGK